MKAVDDQPVWSIICFVVPLEFRGEGIARALLDAAIAYAKKRGAPQLELLQLGSKNFDRLRDAFVLLSGGVGRARALGALQAVGGSQ